MERQAFSNSSPSDNQSIANRAMTECWPGGPIVSSPEGCRGAERDTWRQSSDKNLPNLTITGTDSQNSADSQMLAGQSRKNNGSNVRDSERDAYLDRQYS